MPKGIVFQSLAANTEKGCFKIRYMHLIVNWRVYLWKQLVPDSYFYIKYTQENSQNFLDTAKTAFKSKKTSVCH